MGGFSDNERNAERANKLEPASYTIEKRQRRETYETGGTLLILRKATIISTRQ